MKTGGASFESLSRGDILRVRTFAGEMHGEFIEYRKESGLLVLKLKSGYDIVLPSKEISAVNVLERAKREGGKKGEISESTGGKGDITIITTGGTISSKIDYETGGVSPSVPPDYYLQLAPDMKRYGSVAIMGLMKMLSENMQPADWVRIAKAAYDAVKGGSKGIMVTMGTDTMHFASAAVSFMLNPLSVPVVFTGSQRSPDRGSTDASSNLLLSAITASKWDGAESVICMHANTNDDYNFVLRGNRARKMHTERRDAFRPINSLPLARVFPDGRIDKVSDYTRRSGESVLNAKIDDRVKMLLSYPSMGGDIIDYYIDKKARGIVIAGTGFGNLPLEDKSVYKALKRADGAGIPVVITSQTVYGSTNRFVYSTLRELSRLDNVIYVGDTLTETAFVKLMFVLGQGKKMEEVRSLMTKSLAGEMSDRSPLEGFLI